MKNLNLICAVFLFSAFVSCKKDSSQETTPNKPALPETTAIRDSVSYTIDGKTYSAGGVNINSSSAGAQDANRKLIYPDNTNKYAYSLVGAPDSVMYYQKNLIATSGAHIQVFFLKKYIRQKVGSTWMPGLSDMLKLFTTGKHPLAEDFEWENSQNGIAINVSANNEDYLSYNAYNGMNTVELPPGFQKNSTFEITSFTKSAFEDGGHYNLEAKFTALVFDAAGHQKKVDNGYLRLHFDLSYSTRAN